MVEGKKSHKVLWTILIILIAILAFGLGFFVSKAFNGGKSDSPKQEEKKAKEIAVGSEKVKLALAALSKLNANIYAGDKYDIKNITDEELLATALKQIPYEYVGFCGGLFEKGTITIDTINKYLSTVISNKKVTFDMIKKYATYYESYNDVYETQLASISYFAVKGNDIYVGNQACEGIPLNLNIVDHKVIKAEELDDYLYVYEKKAFYVNDFDTREFTYYSDQDLKNFVETKKGTLSDDSIYSALEQIEDLNWDKYNTYKYTFKLTDGYYQFQSLEIVK